MKIDGVSVLVTGASAGIGREFARQLAGRVRRLVLVARRGERLEELRAELTNRHPALEVHVRVTDLAQISQINGLVDWLRQEKLEIDFLINNAGLGDLGPFATSDPERIERIVSVNMLALTLLTRHLLSGMTQRRNGAVLNVSSSASFLPIAGFSVYAASKAYVTSFSEGLRAELRGTGVSVGALCPGPVHTEFTDVAKRSDGSEGISGPEIVYVSAADVARAGLQAIEGDRALVIPGTVMKIGMTIVRMLPLAVLRFASRWTSKRTI